MPPWYWLQVNSLSWQDDFFMSNMHCLIVSERAMAILAPSTEHAEIEELPASDARM
jgi:hypothetical protein